jgi:non-ribosomal peptide synthetase-like protein
VGHEAFAVRPGLVTLAQAFWLLLGLLLGAPLAWFASFRVLPALLDGLGLITFLLLAPLLALLGLGFYTLGTAALTVLLKRLLVGRYTPRRDPVWSAFFLRHWMVQQSARLIPWRLLEGTVGQQMVLRALGARIGRRVHLHRGANISQGGWDLLEIGDDASLGQDAALRLLDYEDGCLIIGPVSVGAKATLETRAGMGPGTSLGAGSFLFTLSALASGTHVPPGESWDGIPAARTGLTPAAPPLAEGQPLSPLAWSAALLLAEAAIALALALPAELLALGVAHLQGLDGHHLTAWLAKPSLEPGALLVAAALVTLAAPLALLVAAALSRGMGRVQEGVVPRWSGAYLRVWLKGGLVQFAGEWLSGTLFWPAWLNLAGMKVGSGCEISSILDVVPELIEIGNESFFADGIYLGGPLVHQGTVTLARLHISANTFLGNHAVLPGGRDLPDGLLLGVCTSVDALPVLRGSSWFGHPPFELPKREVVEMDRRFTHEPSLLRYWNRVLWEVARFGLLIVPTWAMLLWAWAAATAQARLGMGTFLFAALPLLGLALASFFPAVILGLKWLLLGRVKPGVHPLWSCWCSRWDFLYVAWAIYARAGLGALENSLLLTWYLRAMGMHIGRRVVLGSGFAQVVDPDMLHFEDGATVACLFQAHTFEDRVLKIDRVDIRAGATVASGALLLYGADIGEGAQVAPHSVVLKRERLLPGLHYEGFPTRAVGAGGERLLVGSLPTQPSDPIQYILAESIQQPLDE